MFHIQRFYCCCTLRTGSLVVGYLGLISSFIDAVYGSVTLEFVQSESLIALENSIFNKTTYIAHGYAYNLTQLMSLSIAYNVISLIFNAFLLWGIHKEKRDFLLPWLVLNGLGCVVLVGIAIFSSWFLIAFSPMHYGGIFLVASIFVVCIWFVMYSYACVYSYYHEMNSKSQYEENLPEYIKSFHEEKKDHTVDVDLKKDAF